MSYNPMEQYFEELHRERTREAWEKVSSDIGQVKPQTLPPEAIHADAPPVEGTGISQEQANNDFVWPSFAESLGRVMND